MSKTYYDVLVVVSFSETVKMKIHITG